MPHLVCALHSDSYCIKFYSDLDKACLNIPLGFAESKLSKVIVVLATGIFAWNMSVRMGILIGERDRCMLVNNSERQVLVQDRVQINLTKCTSNNYQRRHQRFFLFV